MKPTSIDDFHQNQTAEDRAICDALRATIDACLDEAESKVWHNHPVWFLQENPIVGYSKLKDCIRLMFWSGADFGEPGLKPGTGKFKDASARYVHVDDIDIVGMFPDYDSAYNAWKSAAQRTVDNAHMRYYIAHIHRLRDEEAAASSTEELGD